MPYDAATIAYAASRGISVGELPLVVNGCSGGLSFFYRLAGRRLSCEGCCNRHDIDYQLGGTKAQRKASDLRLRQCVGVSGGWGWVRAWVMWAAVRLAGRWYWAK